MALETMGDATHETGTREAMIPQSFDDDAGLWKELAREHSDALETRRVTITFPQRIWFRLDRFLRCEGGWPPERPPGDISPSSAACSVGVAQRASHSRGMVPDSRSKALKRF